jgi:hypothetical protein
MRVATARGQARPGHDAHGFLRHLFEMALAMMAGMMVSAAIFLSAVGMTAAEAMREHAVLFVVLQAFGMTVAMVTWMRHRRHTWRSSSEMAAAMVIPAVPLICLRLLDVISGPICGVYCFTTIVAMVVLMLYRRGDYGVVASASRPSRLVGSAEELASFARSEARPPAPSPRDSPLVPLRRFVEHRGRKRGGVLRLSPACVAERTTVTRVSEVEIPRAPQPPQPKEER